MSPSRQRISARDYKHGGRRGGFDLGRYQQFGLGLASGLAVALVVFVFDHRGKPPETGVATESARKKSVAAPKTAPEEAPEQYDYYDMLSRYEVVLPEERNVRRDKPAETITKPGNYIIQAGSFESEAVALRRQQVLAKLGIESAVQRVAIDADVRHRVRIGPIKDLARLNEIRNQLHTADIDMLLSTLPE